MIRSFFSNSTDGDCWGEAGCILPDPHRGGFLSSGRRSRTLVSSPHSLPLESLVVIPLNDQSMVAGSTSGLNVIHCER